jgi:uncharacterized membrane protein YidH (DUF202 family)
MAAEQYFSTWFKLLLGIIAMTVGLTVFKLAFAHGNSPLLDPFYSFVVLVAISVGIYYLMYTLLVYRVKKLHPQK